MSRNSSISARCATCVEAHRPQALGHQGLDGLGEQPADEQDQQRAEQLGDEQHEVAQGPAEGEEDRLPPGRHGLDGPGHARPAFVCLARPGRSPDRGPSDSNPRPAPNSTVRPSRHAGATRPPAARRAPLAARLRARGTHVVGCRRVPRGAARVGASGSPTPAGCATTPCAGGVLRHRRPGGDRRPAPAAPDGRRADAPRATGGPSPGPARTSGASARPGPAEGGPRRRVVDAAGRRASGPAGPRGGRRAAPPRPPGGGAGRRGRRRRAGGDGAAALALVTAAPRA